MFITHYQFLIKRVVLYLGSQIGYPMDEVIKMIKMETKLALVILQFKFRLKLNSI
jgi:hypothetical protein